MQIADLIDLIYEFLDTVDAYRPKDIIHDEDGDQHLYEVLVDSCVGLVITPGGVVDHLAADELYSLSAGDLNVLEIDTPNGVVIELTTPKGRVRLCS